MRSLGRIAFFASMLALTVFAPSAGAHWSANGTGGGAGFVSTMPAPNQPTTSVAVPDVTVSWTQSVIEGVNLGAVGGGYEVRRYPASGGSAVTPNGACGSVITGAAAALSCVETPTPPGEWTYTITPVLHGWTGVESAASAMTTVAPQAPTGFTASAAPAGAISLAWTASPGATGYNVYRSTVSGSFNYAAPLNGATPVAATTYSDTTAVSGTTYYYVIRALVIGGASQQIESASSAQSSTTSDATNPTGVTITNPGTPLRGTIALSGNATDTISGIGSLRFEYKLSAGSTWSTACTDTTAPYSCNFNTTLATDGLNDFRVVATDVAGNSTTSAAVTNRVIDNTAPVVTMTNPGTHIRATVTLSATSTDTGGTGVTAMTIQRSPVGAGVWTNVCTSVTAAVSCNFNTTTVIDGDYDFRATSTDAAGNIGYSTIYTPVRIDNTRPTAADIQTVNAGVLGRPETGDQIVYTFSELMRAGNILAGFTGASMNVTVQINNFGPNDRLRVFNAANTTESALGEVRLNGNYVAADRTFTNSTMVMSGAVLTITLGTPSGAVLTDAGNANLSWRPATTPLDLAGNQMMNTARTETGAGDPNF